MENFENQPIHLESLPRYEKAVLAPISSRYEKIVWFNISVFGLVVSSASLLFSYFNQDKLENRYYILIGSAAALLIILNGIISFVAYKRKAFSFRNHDLIYRSGIISESYEFVPYNRLQHVVLKRGWLSRILNLASLKLFTASDREAVTIPGLPLEEAERVKDLLLDKIKNIELESANHSNITEETNTPTSTEDLAFDNENPSEKNEP